MGSGIDAPWIGGSVYLENFMKSEFGGNFVARNFILGFQYKYTRGRGLDASWIMGWGTRPTMDHGVRDSTHHGWRVGAG